MYTYKEHVLFGVVLRFAQILVMGFHHDRPAIPIAESRGQARAQPIHNYLGTVP